MFRLLLMIAFVAIVAIAFTAILGTMLAASRAVPTKEGAIMPAGFQRITYVLLVLLMLGVTSGLMGQP